MISDPISRLFQISKNNPKKIAISENNRNINYRDFFKLCYLVSQNISTKIPETTPKILVFAGSTIEAYSAIFGTLMSGGFYSPVNSASSDITVLNILKSYSPNLILTSTDLSARIKELLIKVGDQITVLEIDSLLEKVITSEIIINGDNIDFEIDYPKYENNTRKLAYVIFTSGSTGIPKGVMISRYALSHYIDWAISVSCSFIFFCMEGCKLCGGKQHAESPEWTPACSMCCIKPPINTDCRSHTASISTSMASSKN